MDEIVDRLVKRSARQFRVAAGDIKSRCRKPEIVIARQAVYFTLNESGYTLQSIGDALGRTPAAVSYGCRETVKYMKLEPGFRNKVEELIQFFGGENDN